MLGQCFLTETRFLLQTISHPVDQTADDLRRLLELWKLERESEFDKHARILMAMMYVCRELAFKRNAAL